MASTIWNNNEPDETMLIVHIKLSEYRTVNSRQIYNALDMLGDVGGLLDGLPVIGGFLVTIYSCLIKDPLESYLFGSLFKTEPIHNDHSVITARQ